MKKRIDMTFVISTLVCLTPMLLTLALYNRLPEQIPVHWNNAGEIDGYASKAFAGFGLPAVMAALNLFVRFILRTDPKRANQHRLLRSIGEWTIPIIAVIMVPLSLYAAMGGQPPVGQIVSALVGVLFIVIGNYLPKCKQNYTLGIRLPWTLASIDNWNRTHRLGGYLFIVCGVAIILSGWLLPESASFFVLIGTLVIDIGVTAGYSFYLYKRGV